MDCLFPLQLFGLVSFYLVPSSVACFSVLSFCLTYCVWVLLSIGRSLPPVGWIGPVPFEGFLVGGLGPVFLWDTVLVELDLVPLMGIATSSGIFGSVFELSMSLGSLCANRWSCVPVLLGAKCPAGCWELSGQLGGTWA